jgi:menaquinone reductase, multiheme cytochrome c subunit
MLFPKWTNKVPAILLASAVIGICVAVFVIWYWASPKNYYVGYQPKQPIAYSHKIHAGQLGMDCRYCHFNVERSKHAGVPPTEVCMNCHNFIKTTSPEIQKVHESNKSGNAVPWVRIHRLPDFAFFDHSAHVNKGVSCVSCHGRVDQMDEVRAVEPLSMSWCLDCHRNPAPNIRDRKQVTNLAWKPDEDPIVVGRKFMELYNVHPRTDCSTCHR